MREECVRRTSASVETEGEPAYLIMQQRAEQEVGLAMVRAGIQCRLKKEPKQDRKRYLNRILVRTLGRRS